VAGADLGSVARIEGGDSARRDGYAASYDQRRLRGGEQPEAEAGSTVAYRPQAHDGPGDARRPATGWRADSGQWPRTDTGARRIVPTQRRPYLDTMTPGGTGRAVPDRTGHLGPNGSGRVGLNGSGRVGPGGAGRMGPSGSNRVVPPPAPGRRRRSGFAAVLLLLGLLVLATALLLAAGAWVVRGSYPASVRLPAHLAELTLLDRSAQDLTNVVAGLATGAGVRQVVAAVYAGTDRRPVYVVAASGLFPRPERQAGAAMTEFTALGLVVAGSSPADPGAAGGVASCAVGEHDPGPGAAPAPVGSASVGALPGATAAATPAPGASGTAASAGTQTARDVVLCAWADYGSFGVVAVLDGGDPATTAALLLTVRAAVETH
jgi:hypothetical protein